MGLIQRRHEVRPTGLPPPGNITRRTMEKMANMANDDDNEPVEEKIPQQAAHNNPAQLEGLLWGFDGADRWRQSGGRRGLAKLTGKSAQDSYCVDGMDGS